MKALPPRKAPLMPYSHLPSWLQALAGALGLSVMGVALGRMAYHAEEVRAERRKLVSLHLVLEVPIIGAMSLLTWGIGAYFELGVSGVAALGPLLGWMGPRGMQWLLVRTWLWWSTRRLPSSSEMRGGPAEGDRQ